MLVEDGLELLPEDECRRLLHTQRIGRVAFDLSGTPVVVPVNYTVYEDTIVFRTGAGAKLRAAIEGRLVAFEVDDIDPVYHRGWSVLVVGPAAEVRYPEELERLRSLPVRPWAEGTRDHLVRVPCDVCTGRRIAAGFTRGSPAGGRS